MFENLYLREKQVTIAGEPVTLVKLNLADRSIVAPAVSQMIAMAQAQTVKKASKPAKVEQDTTEVFSRPLVELEKAIEENKAWTEMLIYILTKGVKGLGIPEATDIVQNVDYQVVQELILEVIKFNYIEQDASKKK